MQWSKYSVPCINLQEWWKINYSFLFYVHNLLVSHSAFFFFFADTATPLWLFSVQDCASNEQFTYLVKNYVNHIHGQLGHMWLALFYCLKLKQLLCKNFVTTICIPQLASWLCCYLHMFLQKVSISTIKPSISKEKSEILCPIWPSWFHHRRGIGLLHSDWLCAARSGQ